MKNLAHLYTRIIDTPLAIHPAKLDAILGVLSERLGLEASIEQLEAAAKPFKSQKKTYTVEDGIAIIPVTGTLMKKTSGLMVASGSASYETIGAQYKDAMSNPDIKGILLDIDSPGGETSGLFELAELMYASKDKPVYAVANDGAFSAAYAIACCADKLYVPQTGAVGSIGVIVTHIDQSAADTKAGLKYTFIHEGSKKTDGNSHEPLSDSARTDISAEIARQYGMFVALVSRNRGASADAIKATEAGVYYGDNAVPLLADKVGTLEDAFKDLQNAIFVNSSMPAIKPHKTATVKKAWDGPAAKANLKNDGDQAYYTKAFAYRDAVADPNTKSAYSFIHHEVSESGEIGAANLTACSSGIAILNGGRGANLNNYSEADIKGIYAHLAKHIKDAGEVAPDLKSEDIDDMAKKASIDELIALHASKEECEDDHEMKDDGEDEKEKSKKAKSRKAKADPEDDDDEDDDKKKKEDDDDEEDDACNSKKAASETLQIFSLCDLAGMPMLAADFIREGFTVAQVQSALLKARATKSKSLKTTSTTKTVDNADALRTAAAEISETKGTKAVDAFKKHLVKNAQVYLDSMCNRAHGISYKEILGGK